MSTCQRCGDRPVTIRFHHAQGGVARPLEVCARCAVAAGAPPSEPEAHGRTASLDALAPETRHLLGAASRLALSRGYDELETEFVIWAMCEDANSSRLLAEAGLEPSALVEALRERMPPRASVDSPRVSMTPRLRHVLAHAREAASLEGVRLIGPEHVVRGVLQEAEEPIAGTSRLAPFARSSVRDLTGEVREGRLSARIGREMEIARLLTGFGRMMRVHPVLVGEPGVGKTAIAEGLAQHLDAGDAPAPLVGRRLVALELDTLLAEPETLESVLEELRTSSDEVLVFVDSLHRVGDSAPLHELLSGETLLWFGATTRESYQRFLASQPTLSRHCRPVLVNEPTPEETLLILESRRRELEAHHGVRFMPEALVAAVEMADRYLPERCMPLKALELVDEAAALTRMETTRPETDLAKLEAARLELNERLAAALNAHPAEVARLREELHWVLEHIAQQRGRQSDDRAARSVVSPEAVARVLSAWTRIPAIRLTMEESAQLVALESALHRRVVGQEEALRAVSDSVRLALTGLRDPERPLAALCFAGPAGVGKTETARALAEYLFQDTRALSRFDMRDFTESGTRFEHRVAEALRRRPESVILIEHLESAHAGIHPILTRLLDEGRLDDGHGPVGARRAVVIVTARVDERLLDAARGPAPDERIHEALRAHLRPSVLERLDEVVVFRPLDPDQLFRVLDQLLDHTRRRLHAQGLDLSVSDAARERLVNEGMELGRGVRSLHRAVKRHIDVPANRLIIGALPGDRVAVETTAQGGLEVKLAS